MDILNKIQELESKFADPAFPEDLDRIKALRKRIEDSELYENLAKHEAVKDIANYCKDEIISINQRLLEATSETLPDKKRDNLMDKRNFYEWFISLFDKEQLKAIEQQVNEELANYAELYKGR